MRPRTVLAYRIMRRNYSKLDGWCHPPMELVGHTESATEAARYLPEPGAVPVYTVSLVRLHKLSDVLGVATSTWTPCKALPKGKPRA